MTMQWLLSAIEMGAHGFFADKAILTPDMARELLERIRQAVQALEIAHSAGSLQLTVSIGLAQHLPGDTVEHTLERADQALYRAKALGRNRVVVAPAAHRTVAVGSNARA